MAGKGTGLTARKVETEKHPGYHSDSNGLYLQVALTGAKSWVFRFQIAGRRREMGLGSAALISLAAAREAAIDHRRLAAAGIDPIEHREAAKKTASAQAATFRECTEGYIRTHDASWKNRKHAAQWTATLKTYAYPVFGSLPVALIDARLVMTVLEPIWGEKTETASRVRQRIEAILDWARVKGLRSGENPARWKGHLDQSLPAPSKVAKVEHHAALPFRGIYPFMLRLQATDGLGAYALQLTILTAARTSEVLSARWSELNLEERHWTLPAERMKAFREHRIPLSLPVIKLLRLLSTIRREACDFVFPGMVDGKPLSGMAMAMVLRRLGRSDLTVHGFRSTFRDWAAEATNYPSEVVEMALAHAVGSKVEAAYRRGDLLEKRRQLMEDWGAYCTVDKLAV